MIHRDRVTLKYKVPYDPPQYDGYLGVQEYQDVDQQVPATVTALDSSQTIDFMNQIVRTRFRVIFPPYVFAEGIPTPGEVSMEWQQYTGRKALHIDGAIEPHTRGGRIDHYEAITRSVVG